MVRIFEWIAQKLRNFNSWFTIKWNNLIKKLLIKGGL